MAIEVGHVEAIHRYPVKSMRGEWLDAAPLGWHGLDGDRRLALRRLDERGGFPWLTASTLFDLVRFAPLRHGRADAELLPTHVATPEGVAMPVFGDALTAEIARRHGAPVQMMQLDRGIFDDATISVIATGTVREICRLAGQGADVRRFRANIVVRAARDVPFVEDEWLGGILAFGGAGDGPAVAVTTRDLRCVIVNIDPDTGLLAPEVLKTVARTNRSCAGVYCTVTRIGRLAVGQPVVLHR